MKTTIDILREAGAVRRRAATLTAEEKNRALTAMADALLGGTKRILEANCGDVERAKGQIPEVMIDRLSLSESRIAAMAEGVRAIAALEDPVGRVLDCVARPNGLKVERVSVGFCPGAGGVG